MWNNSQVGQWLDNQSVQRSKTGKRAGRRGRKAMGLPSSGTETARPPKKATSWSFDDWGHMRHYAHGVGE
jgi:hypothetical protein